MHSHVDRFADIDLHKAVLPALVRAGGYTHVLIMSEDVACMQPEARTQVWHCPLPLLTHPAFELSRVDS